MMIDIVFLVLMVMAIFKGFTRGLIVAIFSLVSFAVGIIAALKLSAVVANYLKTHISIGNQWMPILSFAVVFIIVVLLVRLGARIVEKTIQVAMLGWVNKLGGVALYILLYTIFFSVGLFYINKIGLIKPDTIADSKTYNFIAPWAPWVIDGFGTVLPVVKNMFGDLESFFDKMAQKATK
jgi:membrane protein required for colicin V production